MNSPWNKLKVRNRFRQLAHASRETETGHSQEHILKALNEVRSRSRECPASVSKLCLRHSGEIDSFQVLSYAQFPAFLLSLFNPQSVILLSSLLPLCGFAALRENSFLFLSNSFSFSLFLPARRDSISPWFLGTAKRSGDGSVYLCDPKLICNRPIKSLSQSLVPSQSYAALTSIRHSRPSALSAVRQTGSPHLFICRFEVLRVLNTVEGHYLLNSQSVVFPGSAKRSEDGSNPLGNPSSNNLEESAERQIRCFPWHGAVQRRRLEPVVLPPTFASICVHLRFSSTQNSAVIHPSLAIPLPSFIFAIRTEVTAQSFFQ